MNTRCCVTTLGLVLMLQATPARAQKPADVPVVARVNGAPIPRSLADELARQRSSDPRLRDMPRAQLIDDLVMAELLSQQARAQGIDRQPEVQAELALQDKNLLAQRLIQQLAAELRIGEPALRARYASEPVEVELDTRHILVAHEAQARGLIAQLNRGAAFAALARQFSTDAASQTKGGHLGKQLGSELAPAYSAAARALRPGRHTQAPVQTPFGWHVIQLVAMKTIAKPPFEKVRESLRQQMLSEQVEAQIHTMRQAARMERLAKP